MSQQKNSFDVILLITKNTFKKQKKLPSEKIKLPFIRWYDGNDIDIKTGQERLYFYNITKSKEKIRQIAKQYGLKVESIRYADS